MLQQRCVTRSMTGKQACEYMYTALAYGVTYTGLYNRCDLLQFRAGRQCLQR